MPAEGERARCPVCRATVAVSGGWGQDCRIIDRHHDRHGFPCNGSNALLWWPIGVPVALRPYP